MWCLARLVPLMIGHSIPTSDHHCLNFLHLLTIIDYLFAPVISHNVTSHLGVLIKDHHLEFTKLYPSCPITPNSTTWYITLSGLIGKYYFMKLNIPFGRCGPLVRFWCMRYEAKHTYFKNYCSED